MEYYVGIDVGGTNLRAVVGTAGASTLEAGVVGRADRATPRGPDGAAVTDAVLEVIRAACDAAALDPTDVVAAGIGSIGPLDLEGAAVVDPVNLPDGVDRVELGAPVEDLLATDEVTLLNDTTAGVVGERAVDPDAPDDLVYVTFSTGVGAGACVDGRVLSGTNGNAGEVGHTTVDPAGAMDCSCGAPGHWEAYCGGRGLPDYARHLHETGCEGCAVLSGVGFDGDDATAAPRFDTGVETSLPLDSPEFSAADVFERAPEDAFAAAVVEAVGEWNAIGVANLVHAYAPSRVAVGGAVALNNPEAVLDPIRERLPGRSCIPVPEVSLTRLGDDVVLYGALARAMAGGKSHVV